MVTVDRFIRRCERRKVNNLRYDDRKADYMPAFCAGAIHGSDGGLR